MDGRYFICIIATLFISSGSLYAQGDYMSQAASAKNRKDYASACELYKKAIEAGQNAYYNLASVYEYNLDDPESAVEWFRKGAVEVSDPYCQGCLADALRDGHGCPKNTTEARIWYSKAAFQWEKKGQYEYALQYYSASAKLGDTTAMRKVSDMYAKGVGCTANAKLAQQWFDLASKMEMRQKESIVEAEVRENPSSVDSQAGQIDVKPITESDSEPERDDLYSVFAKQYVEDKINRWQEKDEFEKTDAWRARIENGRDSLIGIFASSAERQYIARQESRWTFEPGKSLILGRYDSDNEVFLITHEHFGNMLLPVPIERAPEFKMDWNNQVVSPNFYISGDTLALATLRFENPRTNDIFTYSDTRSLNYTSAKIDYNFAEIDFNPSVSRQRTAGSQVMSQGVVSIGGSDVDVNIPEVKGTSNEKTFAVVIGNEHYQTEASVQFAVNDALATGQYFIKTLGIPSSNVHIITDATLNNMRRELNWLSSVSKSYRGEATLIFYYSGHGIPDEASRSAYLLPVDGYGMDVTTGYKLDEIYQHLTKCDARQTLVMLDACFSGASREGNMMHAARGVALKAQTAPAGPSSGLIVMSAATGDETAYPFAAKQHGMFTYFMLRKIGETKGLVKLGELYDYIHEQVSKKSVVENSKPQTPTYSVSDELRSQWRKISLR